MRWPWSAVRGSRIALLCACAAVSGAQAQVAPQGAQPKPPPVRPAQPPPPGPELAARRRKTAYDFCSKLNSSATYDYPLARGYGALCHGGAAGSPLAPCFLLVFDVWKDFAPMLCLPGMGGGAPWATKIVEMMRGKRLLFLGDSLTRQTVAAFLCGVKQAGEHVVMHGTPQDLFLECTVPRVNFSFGVVWLSDLNAPMVLDGAIHLLDRAAPDVVVLNFGMWYGNPSCFKDHPSEAGKFVGDLETGACPLGWRRGSWERDISRALHRFSQWMYASPARRLIVRETSASHWSSGLHTHPLSGPNSSLQECFAVKQRAWELQRNGNADPVAAAGGGDRFCRWPHGSPQNMQTLTMEGYQAGALRRMISQYPGVLLQPQFDETAARRDAHPGGYWFFPQLKELRFVCDCAHWCYDDALWASVFAQLAATLRTALAQDP